jgi:sorting nexin-4
MGQIEENEDQKLTIFPNKVIRVQDPIKHGEGSQAFVSYLISSDFQVRRRFQDFILLYKFLHEAYPASIIPPLPGKAHLTYISGDRFSSEFLERRTVGLQTFIDRVSRHPILGNSPEFEKFLSADQMVFV